MKKSLKIVVNGLVPMGDLHTNIKKRANELHIAGTVENGSTDKSVVIFAAGEHEALELLIDTIYEGSSSSQIESVEIESCSSQKDFRGVFRSIGVSEKS
jgi:acylphosphatase